MPGQPIDPLLHSEKFCALVGVVLTSVGVQVPPVGQRTDSERVHELLSLMHAWVLDQLYVVGPEVSLGAVAATHARTLSSLRDRHPEPDSLVRIAALLTTQAEVLLGADSREGLEEAARGLLIAASRTFAALLTPSADAERPEITEYDVTGDGDHKYEPARQLWLTDALTRLQSSSALLVAARSHGSRRDTS